VLSSFVMELEAKPNQNELIIRVFSSLMQGMELLR
jgi:hypothetical protein